MRTLPEHVEFVAVHPKFLSFASGKRFNALVQAMPTGVPLMVFLVDNGTLMRRLDRAELRRPLRP